MTVYCTRTGAPKPNHETGAGGFWPQWRVCPHCGRGSFLLDSCPDCGTALRRYAGTGKLAVNLLLPAAGWLLCAVPMWQLYRQLKYFAWWISVVGGLVMLAAAVLLLFLTVWLMAEVWSARALLRCCWLWQLKWTDRVSEDDLMRLPVVQRAKDAYYADLAWLEQAVAKVPGGDAAARDILFGRALWLSQICDCPRLAFLRFRLLCHAPLQEGDATDHAAIFRQTVGRSEAMAERMVRLDNGWQTICDCLCMDPQGPCGEWGALLCARLLVRTENLDVLSGLSESSRQRILDTLLFCGADSLLAHADDPIVQQLRRGRYSAQLIQHLPAVEPVDLR